MRTALASEVQGPARVCHSGTTASYRAFLARFPDQHVSVAVLCNAGDSTPRQTLHQVADLYLGDAIKSEPAPKSMPVAAADLDALAGMYRNIERGDVLNIERAEGARSDSRARRRSSRSRRGAISDGDGTTIEFDGRWRRHH